MMLKLIPVFGILDIITFGFYVSQIPIYLNSIHSSKPPLVILEYTMRLFFLFSLLPSAYAHFQKKSWFPYIYYVLFPLHILLMYLSFGFIVKISTTIGFTGLVQILSFACIVLECLRLAYTILAHWKLSQSRYEHAIQSNI